MRQHFSSSPTGAIDALVRHVDALPPPDDPSSRVVYGRSLDLGWGRVYGGQTMAQALAACQRLAPSRTVHSFDCRFLRAGDASQSIRFEADTLMSGRSFSVVHARALYGARLDPATSKGPCHSPPPPL